MGKESHITGTKPRVFVRGIQGHYNLKDELVRLRSMPRVVKARELAGLNGILFRRNSLSGALEAVQRQGAGIELNSALHAN